MTVAAIPKGTRARPIGRRTAGPDSHTAVTRTFDVKGCLGGGQKSPLQRTPLSPPTYREGGGTTMDVM